MQDAGGKRKCTSKVAGEQIAMVCNCGEVDLAFVPPCTAKDVRLMCMSKKAERVTVVLFLWNRRVGILALQNVLKHFNPTLALCHHHVCYLFHPGVH